MPSRMVIPDIKAPHDPTKRNDMELTGLFLDMTGTRSPIPYIDFPIASALRPELRQGKHMMTRGPKTKTAKRDYYFDKEERRIFEGDGFTDPVRMRRLAAMAAHKKDIGGRWVPPHGRISTCGFNTFYDTFAGRIDAMSAVQKTRSPKEPYKPDFVAGAPKWGSYGWNNYTLSKYPTHLPDEYDGPPLMKDNVETAIAHEQTNRLRRPPYKAVGQLGVRYFNKNPWKVDNPPTEAPPPPVKPVPPFQVNQAFKPPGRPKPMKRMKFWGTFNKLVDLGGRYNTPPTNPFRPDFHGKQDLAHPLIPPAGTKRVLVTAVTIENMAGQMDVRKADKQELVYGENTPKPRPFPKIDKAKSRLEAKGPSFRPELYQKPSLIKGSFPLQHRTSAPPNKLWYS